ncbi:MAG: sigma-54 dependent transcriptional regulator [Pseudomonadota bacterium]|nr:sigma-54 dependent transcriptional regulator [Pseudomonadota bacterium]
MNSTNNEYIFRSDREGRKIIYFKPDRAADSLPSGIGAAGWEICPAATLTAVKQLIERPEMRVGVLLLNGEHLPQRLGEIESVLLETEQIKWIGLVTTAGMALAAVRRLIATYLYDYHTLPTDPLRLANTLGHAYGMARLRHSAAPPPPPPARLDEDLLGSSEAMSEVLLTLRKFARVKAPAILSGETGTGKELAARAIHRHSPRAAGPFVAVNCGAIPAGLIHSELFGYEKGAFTGAFQRRIGRIEAANGGTLFLDEIADLPLELQTYLLRFLQESALERLGSQDSVPVDVRIIAATHRDLPRAVAEGRFREDLYYRLNVLHLEMPPLRERSEDIPLLARFYLSRFSAGKPRAPKGFTQEALHALQTYGWPGNVRELINRIRRATLLHDQRLLGPQELGLDARPDPQTATTLEQARNDAEKQIIQLHLRSTRNNISEAARQLEISRITLYRLMEKHDLTRRDP